MRACIFSVILVGLSALTAPAFSQPYGPPPPPYGDRAGVQPLDRLLPGIRRAHPGDFYDAEGPTYGPSGDPHYHLKWMTPDGRVIWYDTDARSGRVLRSSPGRDSFDSEHSRGGPPPGYGRPAPGSFDSDPYRGGPPPGYSRPFGPGYGGRGGFGGAPYGGAPYGGQRFAPRFAPPSGGWHGGGGGGWRGGGGGRRGH
jgi:hypothetical protein